MAWANIDIPTKSFTIHRDEGCRHVFEKDETPLKGLEELKRDGGWIQFEKHLEASQFHSEHFKQFKFIQCSCA